MSDDLVELTREEFVATVADILRDAGVPENRIEWMAVSCPSFAHARDEAARQRGVYVAPLCVAQTLELAAADRKLPAEISQIRIRHERERRERMQKIGVSRR